MADRPVSRQGRPHLRAVTASGAARPRLAEILLDQGAITQDDMLTALALQRHQNLPLGEILMAHGVISEVQLLRALSTQFGTRLADTGGAGPDPALAAHLPAKTAAALNALPWRRAGAALVVLTNRPDRADAIRAAIDHDGPILLALAGRERMHTLLTQAYGDALARAAEARTPGTFSCRDWSADRALRRWLAALLVLVGLALVAPGAGVALLFGTAIGISVINTGVKWLALQAEFFSSPYRAMQAARDKPPPIRRMPVVTILLPLLRERDIAGQLIARVSRLDYPRELLDVLLIVEHGDTTTRAALRDVTLPAWMRAVIVPPGEPRTKPRAMNYALNFARGTIVGVYDAEDAPEPDQIRKVARRFAEMPPDVVCLQGQLDYYNPTHNWLSRCFTLEYATWFRLMLPGVQRLGLFVPLGGTTLFFRRDALEDMGAWDAHNVTEDADLGLRLVRRGYRTEIVETTPFEEANAAVLPWIKQRSRWLKGYAMTWATHMRDPVQLWRDLGAKRFIGFQAQLLGAVLGFAMAPLLWTLVVKLFGLWHPLDQFLTTRGYLGLALFFLASQALTFLAAWRASRLARHRSLRWWIPLLDVYFLLASAAAILGLIELAHRPFHWRKTEHGRFSTGRRAASLQIEAASSFSRTSNAVER